MSDQFTVYMHVNKYNGKRYIGITSQNPVDRWQNGLGYHRNAYFMKAIRKYGWGGFYHLIIFSGTDKETACNLEQWLIAEFKTTDKKHGYNLTTGGEHFIHSEESKRRMSENRKGKNTGHFTELHRQRIKENHAGGNDKRPVICIEQNKVYSSINDASRETGINKKGISGCCREVEHYNTAGGFHWKFA